MRRNRLTPDVRFGWGTRLECRDVTRVLRFLASILRRQVGALVARLWGPYLPRKA